MEKATEIQMFFRCDNCNKWFTSSSVSINTKCPICNNSHINFMASPTLLDIWYKKDQEELDLSDTEEEY
jgi:phage FluMu protein Com